jgi:2-dehydropantoate 2-reductase
LSIKPKIILIYGVGSIGSLFGGSLTFKPNDSQIIFLGRKSHIDIVQQSGLKILTPDKKWIKTPVIQGFSTLPSDLDRTIDLIIVTCKAKDNQYAVTDLDKNDVIGENTKCLLLQNGIGNEDFFTSIIPKEQIYRAITTEGALLLEPGKVKHSGRGTTHIGRPLVKYPVDQYIKSISEWFREVGLHTEPCSNIQEVIWHKCLINVAINPIATIHNVKNGELDRQPELRRLVIDVIEETLKIFKHKNIPLPKENPIDYVLNVAKLTAENKCSMLQDIENGRKTEIDYLNGRLVQEAEKIGVPAPINRELTEQIKHIEEKL